MPQIEIYKSASGDGWFLCRNEMGTYMSCMKSNEASRGKVSAVGIGEFLSQEKVSPEHDTLLRLVGSLVDLSIWTPAQSPSRARI